MHVTRAFRLRPWLHALALAATCTLPAAVEAVSVLATGDVAIIGYNANEPEDFSFVTFVPLDAGTQISFKEGGNTTVTYTTPGGGLPAGSVVAMLNPLWGYSSGGDSITAFQGTSNLYFSANLPSNTIPTGLSLAAKTAIVHTPAGVDAGRYNGTRTGYRPELFAAIANPSNWDHADAVNYNLNTAPYNSAFTITPGTYWTSFVAGGYRRRIPFANSLSAAALNALQLDNNAAVSDNSCVAVPFSADTIAVSQWVSVFFTNTLPAGSAIARVQLHVQYVGNTGNGTMQIHASTNRFLTGWYTNGAGNSAANSGDIAWSTTEAEVVYDVTSLLNTPELVNACEFLMLAKLGSTGNVFFDYIWLEVVYAGSGAPTIDNTAGASAITDSSATLNGLVTAGSPNPRVLVVWGDNLGGADTSQWDRVEDLGTTGVGPFARFISGLLANTTYYYRSYASNSFGAAWSATHATFATAPPTVQFTTLTPAALESAGNVVVGIALSATSALPASVTVSATPGTAVTPADFSYSTTNITIPAGQASASVTLTLTEDLIDETDETLTLGFSSPVGAIAGAAATFTILDNDAQPTVSFRAPPYAFFEASSLGQLDVALSGPSAVPITVQFSTQDGSALNGSDYTATNGTLGWAAGETNARAILVPLVDDATQESSEAFAVLLSNATNAGIAGTNPVPVTIIDEDNGPPEVSNGDGPFGVSSNATTLRGDLISNGGNPTTVRIHYGQTDGGTAAGNWATNVNLGLLSPGVFSNRVSGLITNRTYYYRCSASNGNGLAWAPATTNFLTGPPTVSFVTTTTSQPETNSPALAAIVLSNPARYGEDVTVTFTASGGSALNPSDYTLPITTATIPAGATTTNLAVTIVNDALNENNETFRLALTGGGKSRLGGLLTNTVTIVDDDPLPLITFSNAAYTVSEAATSVTIVVSMDPVAGVAASVDFLTVDGTALAGSHYTGTNGSLAWSTSGGITTGSRVRPIVVRIQNNALSQGDRQFELRLSDPNAAAFGAADRVTITILEDDNTPPQVNNGVGAVAVRARMAVLTGEVLAGVPPPQIKVYWGLTDGGTNASAWSRTNTVGAQEGAFRTEVYGLTTNTTYRYRCFASNPGGSDWADATATFTTGAGLSYYVNDDSLANDVYCTAIGNDLNLGTTPAAPMASLKTVLDTYNLAPADTVYVDTGFYALSATVALGTDDVGAAGPGQDVLVRGSPHASGSVLSRGSASADVLTLQNLFGDVYVTLQHLQIADGRRGIWVLGGVEPDNARGVIVRQCVVRNNAPAAGDGAVLLRNCVDSWVVGSSVFSNAQAGVLLRSCTDSGAISNAIVASGAWGLRVRFCTAATLAYNTIAGHTAYGIQTDSGTGELVHGNTVAASAADGISLVGMNGTVSGNRVSGSGGDGLNILGDGYTVTGNTLTENASDGLELATDANLVCVNNVMALNGGVNANFPLANNRVRFEHNTLYGGNGVHFALPQAVTNRHNIIWATGAGALGIDVPAIPAGDAMPSDYNCLRTSDAASVGRWGGTTCAALADWQSVSWKDPSSLAADPLFVNAGGGDFHLQSRAGSFHGGQWTADPADSPCIDSAAPDAPYAAEPHYSGFRANLGSDGNTPEASKTFYAGGFYALTLTPSPAVAGSVHVSPVAPLYPSNIAVTIWAAVTNGAYSWEGWVGSFASSAVTNTFFVTTNLSLTALFTAAESNTNGVPGSWLSGYGIPDSQAGADADSDGDGMANWAEYYANTVPTNPLSVLAFSRSGRSGARDFVTFRSSTGKLYRVQLSTNLVSRLWTFWPATATSNGVPSLASIPSTGSTMRVFMDPPTTNRPRFYRIDLSY